MCSRDFLPGGETGFAEVEPAQVGFGAYHERVGDEGGGEVVGGEWRRRGVRGGAVGAGRGGRCDGG